MHRGNENQRLRNFLLAGMTTLYAIAASSIQPLLPATQTTLWSTTDNALKEDFTSTATFCHLYSWLLQIRR